MNNTTRTTRTTRNDALEEAAQYCDKRISYFNDLDKFEKENPNESSKERIFLNSVCRNSYFIAAEAIRRMKR